MFFFRQSGLTAAVVYNILLSKADNMLTSGNMLVKAITARLAAALPTGWRLDSAVTAQNRPEIDAVLRIRGPGSVSASILVEAKQRLEPKDLDYLASALRKVRNAPILIAAPFLSPRTQERLRALGFLYADLTGNIRLNLSKPGLYVETRGAEKNPEPTVRDRRSLKGTKAGRLIRALCTFVLPWVSEN